MIPLIKVIIMAIDLYWWAIVIYILLGWLEHFNVINRYHNFVFGLHTFLFRIVEPALHPIRRFVPNLGGIDITPFILIMIIYFFEGMLDRLLVKFPF
ncbi:MAG: YggT family protein [Alphaproteobacteria bacterium]|nr:YggT family protein [Alphaproteobacteria bacterium]